jgi:hypothetical protein
MLLLKTREEHMDAVRRSRRHATDAEPIDAKVGDFLLIQVTAGPPGNETHRVRYAMRFKACEPDGAGESKRIFGHQWHFLISGYEFRILRRPFDIEEVQVSDKNYGQGVIRFAYVDPTDEAEILRRDLLAGA